MVLITMCILRSGLTESRSFCLKFDELFLNYHSPIYTSTNVVWECFHIPINWSSFEIWNLCPFRSWKLLLLCTMSLLGYCVLSFFFFFFYIRLIAICIFVWVSYIMFFDYLSLAMSILWKEKKPFTRIDYCLIDNHQQFTGNINVYTLYMNTCTNTDSLGGLQEILKKKVQPHSLRRERKQSD